MDHELPMSPIVKPSSLDLLDASSASLSLYQNQPKVSTQKIPHRSVLDSFGPGHSKVPAASVNATNSKDPVETSGSVLQHLDLPYQHNNPSHHLQSSMDHSQCAGQQHSHSWKPSFSPENKSEGRRKRSNNFDFEVDNYI